MLFRFVSFVQTGDYFRWVSGVLDVNSQNPGTATVTATLSSVPSGIKVKALIIAGFQSQSSVKAMYIRDLDAVDEAPNLSSAPRSPGNNVVVTNGATNTDSTAQMEIMTNTSQQIGYRFDTSGANDFAEIVTHGWTDRRGRDD